MLVVPLDAYRKKRAASATPEPFGGLARSAGGLFVIQKHAARRTHFDLRLELGGVLMSWAIPKGPSLDPNEKRLAMKVEDHPLEYGGFEGAIPVGNYGAGEVVLWDRGALTWLEDPDAGLASGKLLFELTGYKMRGVFTLVRTKRKGVLSNEWLLIKKPDAWAVREGARAVSEASILSGLTVEDLAGGTARAESLYAEAAALGAERREVVLEACKPMLAESAPAPFSRERWVFELKYDGWRVLAERRGGASRLALRRGSDASATFPEIARAVLALPYDLVLDGEIVVLDADGKPSFSRLQERAHLTRADEAARSAVTAPATYYVFDLLALGGRDLRPLPLRARNALLSKIAPRLGPIRFADHVETHGEALFAEVSRRGLEGMIAKRFDAPYRSGVRSDAWIKVKAERTATFVVVGMTATKGTRAGFGALELAAYEGERLVYVGRVGSGFGDDELASIAASLEPDTCADAPCDGPVPREKGRRWVAPRRVCEVRFLTWSPEGVLRQPVFIRMRDDLPPSACLLAPRAEPSLPVAAPAPKVVTVSNPTKRFFPADGITKGDLVAYYRAVFPFMRRYLRDRPIVLTRFPDGIEGKSFFQHDAPVHAPSWLRTQRLFSEHAAREVDYFVLEDEESLAYVANLGTIPIHLWASRTASLQRADFASIDLDPKSAPFAHVIALARALHALADELELPCFVKTSGQSGLHVLLPLAASVTHEQARTLAFLLARVVTEEHPDIATTARVIEARGGRVYLDTMQNGHGRTLVAPFSVRAVAGAPVSMPLRWSEVGAGLSPREHTIATALARLESLGEDPFAGVLGSAPDLTRVLTRLAERQAQAEARARR